MKTLASIAITIAALALASCNDPQPTADDRTPPGPSPQAASAVEIASEPGAPGLDRSHKGTPAPGATFIDADGEEVSLGDFAGRPVLVNLWATWCVPCVKELPTLDALAGEEALEVLAISQDNGPQPSVLAFLNKLKVQNLLPYHDPGMTLAGATGAQILPTTILYDADGKEVWRFVGDLDWTGDAAAKLLAEAPTKS